MNRSGEIVDGKYRIVRMLGSGGMGAVYAAEHKALGKQVAIKFLHRDLTTSPEVVARFAQEARAAASIGSKSIIDVYDVGTTEDGSPYIVMELLDGESLRAEIARRGALPAGDAIAVMVPLLEALAAAHRKGIVHRDLKPDNVFLERAPKGSPPRVKLLDFGIAKMTEGAVVPSTRTGTTMGTPHYMPPEQARGERGLDQRVDVYAAGVILYEMLTGRCPFEGDNYNALLVTILTEEPKRPRELRPDLSPAIETLILRAIAKDRAQRFASADDLLAALQALPEDGPGQEGRIDAWAATQATPREVAPIPLTREAARHVRARALGPVVAGVVAITAVGAAIWVSAGGLGSDVPRDPPPTAAAAPVVPAPIPAVPSTPAPTLPAPPDPGASAPRSVRIEIEGAPPNARVYFDGAQVPELPLRVAPREVMVPLRVEAEGLSTFSQMIVPDRDRVVRVTMTPEASAARNGRSRSRGTRTSPGGTENASAETRATQTEGRTTRRRFHTDTSEFEGDPPPAPH